jgi:biopolymer transport protein ExbD
MAYRLKSAFKPSERKRRGNPTVALDLIPIMNLVVVLIPLLLQVVVFIELGRIDYNPPNIAQYAEAGPGEGGGGGGGAPEMLNLVVNVIDSAFEVSVFGATSGDGFYRIPLTSEGEHDFVKLQEVLLDIKQNKVGTPLRVVNEVDSLGMTVQKAYYRYDDASVIRIAASPNIDYQTMVTVLDASYSTTVNGVPEPLFTQPVLGQIATVLVE